MEKCKLVVEADFCSAHQLPKSMKGNLFTSGEVVEIVLTADASERLSNAGRSFDSMAVVCNICCPKHSFSPWTRSDDGTQATSTSYVLADVLREAGLSVQR